MEASSGVDAKNDVSCGVTGVYAIRIGDHPQMKGDCTNVQRLIQLRQIGDHPQMKGDCTQPAT